MSLFLGPVHHWMYQKIERRYRRLDHLLRRLVELHGAGAIAGSELPAAGLGELNDGTPLESLVQGFGIHDFLQQQINAVEQAEARLLRAVCDNLNGSHDKALEDLYSAARDFGRTSAREQIGEPAAGEVVNLQVLVDTLHLEAMPCTPVAEGANDGEDFVYRHVQCPHLENWQAAGAEPALMCQLERAWLAGIAEAAGHDHTPGTTIIDGAKACEDRFTPASESAS